MHRLRRGLVFVMVLAMVAVPLVGATVATPTGDTVTGEQAVADSPDPGEATNNTVAPPDPEADVLGWENGYWHNESINVRPEDGLNDSELDAVVSRGMARVEYIRKLEFEETPPVEVITRQEYTEETEDRFANVTESQRLHENIKYEALFMVGENEDALVAQQKNQAGGVGGYYDPQAGEIKIVSENLTTPQMDEITLSQELFHALQDQKFDITDYNQTTRELHNARDGIIEGDGNYVDRLYQQECNEGVWNGTCVMPQDDSPPAGLDLHVGLYQILFQPYSSGPAFVQEIQQSQGWEGVNEVYENPPASTEQTIHTDKYGVDEPTAVSVEDTSQDPWRPQELQDSSTSGNESVSFAQFGEAGLFVALWYPGYETRTATEIIPYRDHLNFTAAGELSQAEPYLYDHPATAGWEGEKLVTYVTDESGGTNETGYVYKLAWESEADATEFRNKWLELMEFRGAQAVEDHQETYRIPDEEPFGDAFYVTQDGDTVTIVNAPTIEDLSLINEGSAPEAQDSGPGTVTATETPTEAGTVTATDSGTETPADSGTETPTEETASANGPGFTVIVALVALGIAALAAKRSG